MATSDDIPTSDETAAELVQALDENPYITARGLTSALQENTNALLSVKRRYRIVVVAVVLLVLVLAFTIKTRHDTEVNLCNRRNDLRSQIDVKFALIADLVEIRVLDSEETVTKLRTEIQTDNCNNISWL